ncbi:transcriptional regulator [Jejudonia soesokkakensis]|uniref:Transcriptional regulator n=1 Tax=Jejudonia soesokkakensis TaxID=1323432 RepID=A0ABW2MU17_9FLAO
MKAILTGDIINSQSIEADKWLPLLRKELSKTGKEPKDWEIYRGDSFQIKTEVEKALELAFLLKATIKQFKELDVRIAIGIGSISYEAKKITESNGDAFVSSGAAFENLKKNTLAIKTPWDDFNTTFTLVLELTALFADQWTTASSEVIKLALEKPDLNQNQLADLLQLKSQSTVSAALKRGSFDELKNVLTYYNSEISKRC